MRQGQKRGSGFLEEPGSDQLQLQTSTFGRSDVRGALVRLRRLLGSQRCFPWICQSLGVSGSSGTESALGPRSIVRHRTFKCNHGSQVSSSHQPTGPGAGTWSATSTLGGPAASAEGLRKQNWFTQKCSANTSTRKTDTQRTRLATLDPLESSRRIFPSLITPAKPLKPCKATSSWVSGTRVRHRWMVAQPVERETQAPRAGARQERPSRRESRCTGTGWNTHSAVRDRNTDTGPRLCVPVSSVVPVWKAGVPCVGHAHGEVNRSRTASGSEDATVDHLCVDDTLTCSLSLALS
ncbi:uncharacterized protein LOC128626158 isoform X1 [Artibeus jamaicensis]|uniref:uncharacterized protein LOC128626158 isoform X1 n=1 Tax=Artibeus jamaicensis TaxID=9417 RepID=UPI00235B2F62|nr:uncharacterized protein LOC128626158 isoform X1 [Artibeus jamaicensis]